MKIGVVSDTHDNLIAIKRIKSFMLERGIDLIIHLGDFISPFSFKEVYSGYEGRGFGVFGNNDGEQFLISRLAEKMNIKIFNYPATINLDNKKILILHGFGDANNTLEIVRGLAYSGKYDVILFGHTHQFLYERVGDLIVVNPGEGGGWLTGNVTFAEIDTRTLHVERFEVKI